MKVLLISHNPISTFNNMGKTFLNMFSCFTPDELCQLYVRPTTPDVYMCSSYYRITDKQALKSVFFGTPGGEVNKGEINRLIEKREEGEMPVPPSPVGIKYPLLLIRDLVWKCSRWYSKNLKYWIKRENPTCIFLSPGYSSFIYNIALRIAEDFNLPLYTYICDDYYFINKPHGIIGRIQFSMRKRATCKIMSKTKELVVISEELKSKYSDCFGVSASVIMTGAGVEKIRNPRDISSIKNISYFGNIGDGRNNSLADIGRALDEINAKHHTSIKLNIYSSQSSSELIEAFLGIKSVNLCGFVVGDVYNKAFSSSDMLLHTESFEEEYVDKVKHSVSTKIADSLASGIPLFAYGPDCVSSMKHLIRHNCAVTATSKADLQDVLEMALFDVDLLRDVSVNAHSVSLIHHNNSKNSEALKAITGAQYE